MSKKSIPGVNDYLWSYTEEPHCSRRDIILAAHKEVKSLYGYDWREKYFALVIWSIQLTAAYYCGKPTCPWWVFICAAWIVGGTCVHSTTLAIHEMSHNLFFQKSSHNNYYSYFINLPMVIAYAANFKKYHLEHHKKQGHDVADTDIPTEWEGKFFTTPFRKAMWVTFQSFFYALRPLLLNPKAPTKWDALNWTVQLIFDFTIYYYWGAGSIGYLLLSVLLGLGPHPCAGHFIAEHYTCIWTGEYSPERHESAFTPIKDKGDQLQVDETFTYRGPLNLISYNVGYHAAHHDFPFVPGSRLPELEKMAPDYYKHVPECKSWPGTIWRYIFSPGNPFDRVKRKKQVTAQKVSQDPNVKKTD